MLLLMVIPTSFSTPTFIDCSCLDLDLKNKEKRETAQDLHDVEGPKYCQPTESIIIFPAPAHPNASANYHPYGAIRARRITALAAFHLLPMFMSQKCETVNGAVPERPGPGPQGLEPKSQPHASPECWPMPPPSPRIDTSRASHHKNTPLCFCPLLKGSLVTK